MHGYDMLFSRPPFHASLSRLHGTCVCGLFTRARHPLPLLMAPSDPVQVADRPTWADLILDTRTFPDNSRLQDAHTELLNHG